MAGEIWRPRSQADRDWEALCQRLGISDLPSAQRPPGPPAALPVAVAAPDPDPRFGPVYACGAPEECTPRHVVLNRISDRMRGTWDERVALGVVGLCLIVVGLYGLLWLLLPWHLAGKL